MRSRVTVKSFLQSKSVWSRVWSNPLVYISGLHTIIEVTLQYAGQIWDTSINKRHLKGCGPHLGQIKFLSRFSACGPVLAQAPNQNWARSEAKL